MPLPCGCRADSICNCEFYDPKTGAGRYAVGGYIPAPPEGSVAIQLSRGHTRMSLASYRALGPEGRKELFPNTDIELVLSVDEVRTIGPRALERLQHELDTQDDD